MYQLQLEFNIVLLETVFETIYIEEWVCVFISGSSENVAGDLVVRKELPKAPFALGEERASSAIAEVVESYPGLTMALKYHDAGFSVIPVTPRQKAPILYAWEKYSTTRSTKEEIERWWKGAPNANVGIALGPANGTDGRYLFVVDQDVLKDEKKTPILNEDGSFKLMGDITGCPATLSQTTGSGAKQFFYWAPQGYVVGNPKPRPLIDIKRTGGSSTCFAIYSPER